VHMRDVEPQLALLHGDVGTTADAAAIEAAVAEMPGVEAVESHLHVGLLPSDSRPSSGRATHPLSPARRQLEAAAVRGGCDGESASDAVGAVLTVFIRRLPPVEAQHVLGHFRPTSARSFTETHGCRSGGSARSTSSCGT